MIAMLFAGLLVSTAISAQDELVGTWELRLDEDEEGFEGTTTMTLSANGDLEILLEAEFPPEFFGDFTSDDEDAPDLPLFTEGIAVRIAARGSWEADDEEFTLSIDEVEFTINGLSVDEFFREAAFEMAAALAEELEISEEDFPDFEETVVESVMVQFDPEGFGENLSDVFGEEETCHYEIVGGILIVEDEFGDETEFRRIVVASVVTERSWGQVKSGLR